MDEFKRIATGVTTIDKSDDSKSIYGFASGYRSCRNDVSTGGKLTMMMLQILNLIRIINLKQDWNSGVPCNRWRHEES